MTVTKGLSDCHKMLITMLKKSFQKAKPREVIYRIYRDFNEAKFKNKLKSTLKDNEITTYNNSFSSVFLQILNKHAPCKKKILRGNHVVP